MAERGRYASPAAVEAAIRQAARAAGGPSDVDQRVRQAHFDRFLCRIFSQGDECEWVLKGGTGMLARVPGARTTLDIDLFRSGYALDAVIADLRRLAEIDLEDHFRFVYVSHESVIAGEQQPYTDGVRVKFETYLGVKRLGELRVDLAIGKAITGTIETIGPGNRLLLPRLVSYDYRLYPVVDQVADKVCATMATYASGPSSREKDLVDLVIIANTQELAAHELHAAIDGERRRRLIEPFARFVAPERWGLAYTKLARNVPVCGREERIGDALALMERFIDPVLRGEAIGSWHCSAREWRSS